ncbi:hypothetical protein GX51_01775 [Blastomyces parvus]|uniref:Uncharacterized protein n=1 Tax=Blastomyces parvus TaxID=2060905 RepID=A0A2B7X744_9EURO|nr:hypothetical protein GX51_01775 [Blastomyces parvus]
MVTTLLNPSDTLFPEDLRWMKSELQFPGGNIVECDDFFASLVSIEPGKNMTAIADHSQGLIHVQ